MDRTESLHFPVVCEFGQKPQNRENNEHFTGPTTGQTILKFRWNEDKLNEFLYQFRNEMFTIFSVLNASLLIGIDSALQCIVDLYQTCANCMLVRGRAHRKPQPHSGTKNDTS